ncbi:hypothetical protein IVB02_34155 [Bradyrhizobium sp. 166]|nr:hypothetical protein [Bradyrhizobium sp. 166]
MTMASNVLSSPPARILIFAPDIQTSLHTGDVMLGCVMQSLSSRIFQVTVQDSPI